MRTTPTYRRKRAVWAILLVYFFSLTCHVVFVHSHWREGHLVALHAHPYDFGSEGSERKKSDTHSNEEYALHKLIFTSPLLELGFYQIKIASVTRGVPVAPAALPRLYTDQFRSYCSVRGPPLFVSFFSMRLF